MRPSRVCSLRPRLRTVSIMPGMENLAPERTDTRSGFAGSPKPLPEMASTSLTRLEDVLPEARGQLLAGREVVVAGFRRDGEAGRGGQTGVGHLGEAGALAAEEVLHGAVALGAAVAPGVDVALGGVLGPGRSRHGQGNLRVWAVGHGGPQRRGSGRLAWYPKPVPGPTCHPAPHGAVPVAVDVGSAEREGGDGATEYTGSHDRSRP